MGRPHRREIWLEIVRCEDYKIDGYSYYQARLTVTVLNYSFEKGIAADSVIPSAILLIGFPSNEISYIAAIRGNS